MDFATKTIEYKQNSLKLQIWDSAGLERYRALIPSYVRGASIIFLVYDVSSKSTFDNLSSWISFIKEVNTDNSLVVLCGNKTDLERQVSTEEGKEIADRESMMFFETSAKTGKNINKMMYTCISGLPFFAQFQVESKEKLIQDLEEINAKNVPKKNNNKEKTEEPMKVKNAPLQVQAQNNDNKNNEPEKKKKKCCFF